MPEKVKITAKPATNLMQNIRSPRPSEINGDAPKSKHYRSELEPLLGAVITLNCSNWTIFHEEHYTKILLKNASVMKAPSGRCVPLPITVNHVWVAVDPGWEQRNNPREGDRLLVRGFIEEYISLLHNTRNVGVRALSIRIVSSGK